MNASVAVSPHFTEGEIAEQRSPSRCRTREIRSDRYSSVLSVSSVVGFLQRWGSLTCFLPLLAERRRRIYHHGCCFHEAEITRGMTMRHDRTENELGRREFVRTSVGAMTAAALGPGIIASPVVGAPPLANSADDSQRTQEKQPWYRISLRLIRPDTTSPGGAGTGREPAFRE